MICAQVRTTKATELHAVSDGLQVLSSLRNGSQNNIFSKDNGCIRFLHKAKHLVPKILFSDILTMSGGAEGLARKASAQDIKFTFEYLSIQFTEVTVNFKRVHPAVFLALFQNFLAKIADFNTGAALVS